VSQRPKRQYSDDERAAALAALDANGGNVNKTAREEKIPRVTLIEWRDGRHPPVVSNIRQRMKGDLAAALEEIAWKCVEAWPAAIDKATAGQIGASMTVCVEKMRLLRDQPTGIQETRDQDLTPDERTERISELLDHRRYQAGLRGADAGGDTGAGPAPDVLH